MYSFKKVPSPLKKSNLKYSPDSDNTPAQSGQGLYIVEDSKLLIAGLNSSVKVSDTIKIAGASAYSNNLKKNIENSGADIVLFSSFSGRAEIIDDIKKLKLESPYLKIIILTEEPEHHELYSLVRAGIDGYCLKHNDPEEIVKAIEIVASGGKYICHEEDELLFMLINYMGDMNQIAIDRPVGEQINLTKTEIKVMEVVSEHKTNEQIAKHFNRSVDTIKAHLKNIYKKMDVHSRAEAIIKFKKMTSGFGF